MSNNQAMPPTKRRLRGGLRRLLTQFSLRSLLIATTLTAFGCWWFLRPEVVNEQLAGNALQLRRQVRVVQTGAASGSQPAATTRINHGDWWLLGKHGDTFVEGHYADDVPHGVWTTYHLNGKLAARGQVARGARVGPWQTWDEQGRLRSEATFTLRDPLSGPPSAFRTTRQTSQYPGETTLLSHRSGPAKGWWANGKLRFDGQYAADQRTGLWTYYAADDSIVARGEYLDDRRYGPWQLRAPNSPTEVIIFEDGATQSHDPSILARCEQDLHGDDRQSQIVAARRLATLGTDGAAYLERALVNGDDAVKLLALRELAPRASLKESTLAHCEKLAGHADHRIAAWAEVALYLNRREGRQAQLDRLMKRVSAQRSEPARLQQLLLLCDADDSQRGEFFREIMQIKTARLDLLKEYPGRFDTKFILAIGGDLPAMLAVALQSPDARIRLGVVQVLDAMVERRTSGQQDPIPTHLHPLVEQCRADANAVVRFRAEQIGVLNTSGSGIF